MVERLGWSCRVTSVVLSVQKFFVFSPIRSRWLGKDQFSPTYPIFICPWVSLGDIMGVGTGKMAKQVQSCVVSRFHPDVSGVVNGG